MMGTSSGGTHAAFLSPTKEKKGLAMWESVVYHCDTLEKTHQQITDTLLDVENIMASSGAAALQLRNALQEYKKAIKSFTHVSMIWDDFFKTFMSVPGLENDADLINEDSQAANMMRKKADSILGQTPLVTAKTLKAFEHFGSIQKSFSKASQNVFADVSSIGHGSFFNTPQIAKGGKGDQSQPHPFATPARSVARPHGQSSVLCKQIFKGESRPSDDIAETPDSVGSGDSVTFLGSPPVTIPFAHTRRKEGDFKSKASLLYAGIDSPGASSFLPSTPASLKDAKQRLTEIGLLGTPMSDGSGRSSMSLLLKTPAAIASAASCCRTDKNVNSDSNSNIGYVMDELSLSILRSSEVKMRRRQLCHETTPSINANNVNPNPNDISVGAKIAVDFSCDSPSSVSIASLDLAATPAPLAHQQSDSGLQAFDELDLSRFPPVFRQGDGAQGLLRIFSVFKDDQISEDNGSSFLTIPVILDRLNTLQQSNKRGRSLDQDTCFLLLDLLVRKRYLKVSQNDLGETAWSLNTK